MVATSVNRTALHPGGVQYVAFLPHCPYLLVANCLLLRPSKGHTELEEELHETAHIDYDRVSIVRPHHPCP